MTTRQPSMTSSHEPERDACDASESAAGSDDHGKNGVRPALCSFLEEAGLLGMSEAMAEMGSTLRKIAHSDSTVLITGESGTGKELVAKILHVRSPRSAGPFVAVNCAAVPESLIESEFFGHTRGAFTGATAGSKGLFEQASGGTLFLDEVGEIGAAMQTKLLRALQERKVRPVGGQQEVDVDVRLLAATNRRLEEEVRTGSFREDLFYRLNVLTVHVPNLRERNDDVLLLAEHFIAEYAERMGKHVKGLSDDAKVAMSRHSWPGNVRELQSCIERAVTLAEGSWIQPSDLPPAVIESADLGGLLPSVVGRDSLPTLSDLEWRYIRHVLSRVDGNKTHAAKLLGINRRTLHRKLQGSPSQTPEGNVGTEEEG
jgi:DNA-binding NtrC family response regulator